MHNTLPTHTISKEISQTLRLGMPLIAAQLIYGCSMMLGTAMVAHLGKEALAASVLVSILWTTMSVLFIGILESVSVLIAHQFGSKNEAAISDIMGQAYLFGLLMIIGIILILYVLPVFFSLSSQPPSVLALARQYTHSFIWLVPGMVALIITEQFLAGIGHSKIVMWVSILIIPIEIPLNYILIFGKLGLPACGISGIGYGLAITLTISAMGLMLYLHFSKNYQRYKIFSKITTFLPKYFEELVRVGLPMGLMHVIEVSAFAVITFWIAQFGTTPLAAHQLMLQFTGFAINLVFGMASAVTIRVGHYVGENDLLGIRYAVYTGTGLNFIFMLTAAIILYFFPELILQLDMDVHNAQNAALFHTASLLLGIGSVLLLCDNWRIIGFGALRGLKDTRFAMYTSLMSFWLIGLGTAYWLGFKMHFGSSGVWWGMTVGIACGAVMVLSRLEYLMRTIDLKKLLALREKNISSTLNKE